MFHISAREYPALKFILWVAAFLLATTARVGAEQQLISMVSEDPSFELDGLSRHRIRR
jgi:hypothetical protein